MKLTKALKDTISELEKEREQPTDWTMIGVKTSDTRENLLRIAAMIIVLVENKDTTGGGNGN